MYETPAEQNTKKLPSLSKPPPERTGQFRFNTPPLPKIPFHVGTAASDKSLLITKPSRGAPAGKVMTLEAARVVVAVAVAEAPLASNTKKFKLPATLVPDAFVP